MSDILATYNVSRETLDNLKKYEILVKEWNEKFNLISKSSAEDLWNRHIMDSLQLCRFIETNDKNLYDLGSGAGFPAIVIAIISKEKYPELNIHLVESITKKAMFLNEVKKNLDLNVEVINDRIENLKIKNADIITSRALAALPKLFEYAKPLCKNSTKLVFPKGKKWQEELKSAKEKWIFDYENIQSQTDDNGHILYIHNLRRK